MVVCDVVVARKNKRKLINQNKNCIIKRKE
jgi:hypothetical protein